MMGSLVIQMAHLAIRSDLRVDVATLALIQIDFCLLLANTLRIVLYLPFHGLACALLFNAVSRVALLEQTALVIGKLRVQSALLVVEVANQVKQLRVLLDTRGQFTLSAGILRVGLLNALDSLLLG